MARDEMKIIQNVQAFNDIKASLQPADAEAFENAVSKEINETISRYTYRPIYDYKRSNVTKRWMYLVIFTLVYALICVISLEFIDRDQR